MRNPEFAHLESSFGIIMPDVVDYYPAGLTGNFQMAMDAQPSLVTVSNAGIPSYLSQYIDPKIIEVLTAPNQAAEIAGEAKKGDWTTLTAVFPIIEHTGEVASYGDWSENGSTSANPNFPQRQSYHYQTITQWGERQLDMAAQAKIDWASRLNIASVMVLNKFQNLSYFFGVAGLQNYGLLNDPSLSAPITPGTKAVSTPKWVTGNIITATANEIYADFQALFVQLTNNAQGLIDQNTRMVVGLSPQSNMALTATNTFNVSVMDLLKKNFPNIRFVVAPQYATAAGQLVQMLAEEVEGQEVCTTAFTEKLRSHPIIRSKSSLEQKKSQGTWGTIIYVPFAIASMIGV